MVTPRRFLDRSLRGRWASVTLTLALSVFAAPLQAQAPTGSVDAPLKTSQHNPDAVAVVIGISHYQNPDVPEVDFAVRDAHAIHDVLIQTFGYSSSRVLIHTDAEASLAQLKPLIRQELPIRVVPGKSDVFVYYSGHGAPNPEAREGFLIPWDYDPSYQPASDSAYPLRELYADLAKLKARSVTVVLDACFSGQSDAGRGGMVVKDASPAFIEVQNAAVDLPKGLVITATGPQEIATWDRAHQHGLLTYYLLQALHGEAADEQGRVTVGRLEQYLKEKVSQAAEESRHRKQTPHVVAMDPNQVLARLSLSGIKAWRAMTEQAYGSLRITLLSGGELYIDEVEEGTFQAGQVFYEGQIPAGPHLIELRKEGQQPVQEQVVVMAGRTVERTYNFLPKAPRLARVTPTPLAEGGYRVPIQILNEQALETPAPFAQQLIVDSSKYAQFEADNLQNIEFIDQTGRVISSWLESGNSRSATRTVYWLRLTRGIPPNRAVTVYMVFGRTAQIMLNGTTTGEAPGLSGQYGQFDNGAQVFTRYANFAGTSLPRGWASSVTPGSPGAVEINNGVNIWQKGTGSHKSFLGSDWVVGENVVEMHLLSEMTNNGQDMLMFCSANRRLEGWTPNTVSYQNGSGLEVENTPGGTPAVLAAANPTPLLPAIIGFQGSTVFANYDAVIRIGGRICGSTFLGASVNTGYNASFSFDWVRMRPAPSANVMPRIVLGGANHPPPAPP